MTDITLNEGCWFDGARGIYSGEAIIAEARELGWEWQKEEWEEADFNADSEHYHEAWDGALDYLASLAPEGFWIGPSDSGDFGMWKCEDED